VVVLTQELLLLPLTMVEFEGEDMVEVEAVDKVPPGEEQRLGDEKEASSGVVVEE
jgi:hypothetical protein